jgi:hypothetical protein
MVQRRWGEIRSSLACDDQKEGVMRVLDSPRFSFCFSYVWSKNRRFGFKNKCAKEG